MDYKGSLFYDVASGRYVRARATRGGAIAFSGDGTAAAWTESSILSERGADVVWMCRFAGGETRRVRTPISARVFNLAMSPGGQRVAVVEENTIGVFEVPSGRLLASAARDLARHDLRIVFLSEQKLRIYRMDPLSSSVAGDRAPGPASIGIVDFEIDARKLKQTASIENIRRPFGLASLGGEPAAGQISLAIGPAREVWGAADAYLLDLNSGALRKLGSHLVPIAAHLRWRLPQPEPGSETTRLFVRSDGSVLRLDPGSGELRTILPGR